jgi:hypothetical protein
MIASFSRSYFQCFSFHFLDFENLAKFYPKNLAKLVEIHYTSKNKFQIFPNFFLCQKMAKIGPDKIIFILILNCFLLIDDNHFGYKQKKNPNINLKTKHCNSGRRCR